MNSRSEQRASHCVRTPLTIHLSCRAFVCYDCFVFTVCVPLYLSVDPKAAIDYTPAGYGYFVDDRTPTVELPGKQSHSLPQISPIFPYFLALGITAAATISILFNCIACFCRPLMYLPLSYAACCIYFIQQ